jgi:hypothetical protein
MAWPKWPLVDTDFDMPGVNASIFLLFPISSVGHDLIILLKGVKDLLRVLSLRSEYLYCSCVEASGIKELKYD